MPARRAFPRRAQLGIVTISGGGGILMADVASDYGLELPRHARGGAGGAALPIPYCAPRNPVDITAQAFNRMELFAGNLK
jgi:acyl-CoA synthetase (NDP forming)